MKVDRGTADEPKQLWRGRRGRSTLGLIFAIFGRATACVSSDTTNQGARSAAVGWIMKRFAGAEGKMREMRGKEGLSSLEAWFRLSSSAYST